MIEDDYDHRKIAEMVLRSTGIDEITFFNDGEEAIAYFEDHPSPLPDEKPLIFIDLMLPRISGFEILKHLGKSPWAASRKVVLTCSTSPQDRARCEEFGADLFLVKPLRRETVKELLTSDG